MVDRVLNKFIIGFGQIWIRLMWIVLILLLIVVLKEDTFIRTVHTILNSITCSSKEKVIGLGLVLGFLSLVFEGQIGALSALGLSTSLILVISAAGAHEW